MAKTSGPLLSLGARGTIAGTMTFASWRGVGYARQRVIPANPNSTGQQSTRNAFSYASALWKTAPALFLAPWDLFAQGQPLTGRNAYISSFVSNVRGETDLQAMVFSPGAKGGLPPDSIAITAGSNQLQVDFTNPDAPTGWTLVSAIAAAVLDSDYATDPVPTIVADEDATTQAQVTLTGLTASSLYAVGAWLEWTKADGTTAYGSSVLSTATPTV